MIYLRHRAKFHFRLQPKHPKQHHESYVDSTGQWLVLRLFMRYRYWQHGKIENKLWTKINKIFPSDRYKVVMTGKALVFRNEILYLTIY
jgi:hypothetical protein